MEAIAILRTFVTFVGAKVAVAMNIAASAQATMAIGSAVIAGSALVAKKAMSLFEVKMSVPDTDRSRQSTVKSASEPQKIIYGEALVSGPISFIGLGGVDNKDLYQTIVLAGHEVNAITDVYFDDFVIDNNQIDSGNTAGGAVNAGAFQTKNNVDIVTINKYRGTNPQTADQMFVGQFGNYTNDHRGDGIAYLAMKWVLNGDSAKTWDKYAPRNVKALVQGKKVYDPRLEVTAGGDAGDSPNNSSYIAYSDNPALCAIDYLMDQNVGLSVPSSKIDWSAVITAANGCDATVTVPGGTEKTFTCNGVVFATDTHQKNINKILSSMNGSLVYSNGKYVLRAGIYANPTVSLNEDDLIGSITVKTSIDRSERVNTIKGLFLDPSQGHKMVEFPKVQLSNELQRDNNVVMEKETSFAMTNTSYMAQRLAHKIIKSAGQQKVITFPANYTALNVTAGDRVQVSIDELSWVNKEFICVGWVFSEDGGVLLTLREDSSDAYSNPTSYSQVSGTGTITDASRGVPSPSGLQVESAESKIFLNWVNPTKPSDFNTIEVWASATNVRSDAVNIGETNGTQFTHDQSNSAITYAVGDTLYYWVRAKKNVGDATDTDAVSGYFPATTTSSANVTVTAAAVDWGNVANPTIGINLNNDDSISIDLGDDTATTSGQAVAQSGISEDVTITQGGIRMNQGGSIRGGQTSYNSGEGFFLGFDSNKYKLSIRNSTSEALTFDGDDLSVTGTVNASAGAFTGDVSTDSKFIAGSSEDVAVVDGGDDLYRFYAGHSNPTNAAFRVDKDGHIDATNIRIYDTNGQVILDDSGLHGVGLGNISADSGVGVAEVAGRLDDNADEITFTTSSSSEVYTFQPKVQIDINQDAGSGESPSTSNLSFAGADQSAVTTIIGQVKLIVEYFVKTSGGSYSGTPTATQEFTFVSGTSANSSQLGVSIFTLNSRGAGVIYANIGASEAISDPSIAGARTFVKSSADLTFANAGTYNIKVNARIATLAGTTLTTSTTPALDASATTGTGVILGTDETQSSLEDFRRLYTIKPASGNTKTIIASTTDDTFSSTSGSSLLTTGGTISGSLVVTGDLTTLGTTTTVNTDELTVKDPNITLNYSTGDSSSTANNAGITIQDAVNSTTDASMTWNATDDRFEFSHLVNVDGGIRAVGLDNSNTAYSGIFRNLAGSNVLLARNDGRVFVPSGYLFVQHSDGIYSTGAIKARGGITNDGGNNLSISSGGTDINFNSKNFTSVGTITSGAIASSGRVDITTDGTISEPYVAFGITSTSVSAGLFLNASGGGRKYEIQSTNADELIFYDRTNSAYRARIKANGNFEITNGSLAMGTTTVIDSSRNGIFSGVQGTAIGVDNTGSTSKRGLALYGGSAGATNPTYGIMFTGTAGSGTHGSVTGDWATYFTMNDTATRGWIFRAQGSGNVASISGAGNATFNGTISSGAHTITSSGTIGGASGGAGGYLKIQDGTDTLAFDTNEIHGTERIFLTSEDAEIVFRGLSNAGVVLKNGSTSFMDASRNLTNIGTISSGAITSTGTSTFGGVQIGGTTVISSSRNLTNIVNITTTGTMGLGTTSNSTNYLLINRVTGNPNIKSSDAYLLMDSSGGMAGLNWYSSDRVVLANGGGNVSIGSTGNYSQKLYVSGSVRSTSSIRADAGFDVSGTTVIDSSRNLTNIGTISSGTITSSGTVKTPRVGMGISATVANSVGHTATYSEGIFWHTTADSYGIFREAGAWTHPTYQTLKITWATGIKLDGGTAFSQCGVDIISGNFKVGGTTVIDSSRSVFANQYYYAAGKIVAQATDSYLRINQSNQFGAGIWTGSSSLLSATTYIATGSNGGKSSSRVYMYGGTYNGTNVIALDGTDGKIKGSYYTVGTTTVIDSSRNIFVKDVTLGTNSTLIRSNHHTGHMEGSYNNVGNNSAKSNPIYTIGSSYNPTDAALSNMYGIGFAKKGDATYLSGFRQNGWGLYVAADGDARVWLNATAGVVASTAGYDVGNVNVIDSSRNLNNIGTITSGSITSSSYVQGITLGVTGSSPSNGRGISLYGGASAGQPTYGLMFQGTGTFGTHGSVTGNWATYFTMNNSAGRGWIFRDVNNGNKASISNAGNATFDGTLSSGAITSTGNVTAYSDERLKDNIKTLDGSKVLQMRGVSFTKDGEAGSGVIAQELELTAPELVHTADDDMGTKSVAYGNLVGYLIENAKQQQNEIDELKALVKLLMEK